MKKQTLFLVILFIGVSSFGQSISIDTIEIYKYKKERIMNPHLDKIDTLDSTSAYTVNWKDCPTYYFLEGHDSIPLEDKIRTLNKNDYNNYSYCQIESDWKGNILSIIVTAYSSKPNSKELKKFFSEVKVVPLKKLGYPVGSKCTYKIKHP